MDLSLREKARLFWERFSLLSEDLLSNPESSELIRRLDRLVQELGDFDWEYGPSAVAEFYFSISPNFRVDLIQDVNEIVAVAPRIINWELIAGRPRKREILNEFVITNIYGEDLEVNAKDWMCILYKFKNQTYDLDVQINGLHVDEETQYQAVEIHISNLIGEMIFLSKIKNISIVEDFDSNLESRAIPLVNLREVNF
ncbi:MAG: hypothetical protein AAFQ83_17545 [Bacteroidota bacterium]